MRDSGVLDAKPSGPRAGEIDHAVGHERAAVIDAQHHASAVAQVRDPYSGLQGQDLVGAGGRVLIVDFSRGRRLSVKVVAVPGGRAFLDEPLSRRQRVPGSAFFFVGDAARLASREPAVRRVFRFRALRLERTGKGC